MKHKLIAGLIALLLASPVVGEAHIFTFDLSGLAKRKRPTPKMIGYGNGDLPEYDLQEDKNDTKRAELQGLKDELQLEIKKRKDDARMRELQPPPAPPRVNRYPTGTETYSYPKRPH